MVRRVVIKDTVKKEKCPKAGFVILYSGGETFYRKTACKTWRCKVCQTSLLSLVQMKMEYGCLMLGESWLTTLTLKSGEGESQKDADFVRKAWDRWSKKLKQGPYPELAYFRVIELTKKKQPHLHLLLGNLKLQKSQCSDPDLVGRKKWMLEGMKRGCECGAHVLGSAWYEITGAYVIDVAKVYDGKGAGRYLGKYLTKAFDERRELERLGFSRRYTASRNWPGNERVRLRGTVEKRWDAVTRIGRDNGNWRWFEEKMEEERPAALVERIGTPLAHVLEDRRIKGRRKAAVRVLERVVERGNTSVQEYDVLSQRSGGE